MPRLSQYLQTATCRRCTCHRAPVLSDETHEMQNVGCRRTVYRQEQLTLHDTVRMRTFAQPIYSRGRSLKPPPPRDANCSEVSHGHRHDFGVDAHKAWKSLHSLPSYPSQLLPCPSSLRARKAATSISAAGGVR